MKPEYILPYIISQVVSLVILILALKKPVWMRYLFSLIFIAAGIFNWITSLTTPEAYMMYSDTAIPFYRTFINGWFREHITLIVPMIATGQVLIGVGMAVGHRWLAAGCLGIILFLLGIAPLGVGSAFPFSITVSVAAFFVYRHWQLRWGATKEEVSAELPGDNLVEKPDFNATRAITIKTTPGRIFPWIIQIGSKRAGWYSIDRMDNGGKPSAKEIIPSLQQIEKGQFIPFTPDQKNGMWVKEFEKDHYILWSDNKGKASWLWYLKPVTENETRLLTCLHTKYDWNSLWILYYLVYDFGDIVMMSKCMKGIKQRAEKK